ncbi:MAG TPA: hypothetical protein PKY77_19575 [Phycisphaerae bacterium]|nr:hypothetical protein [Phycisphaerae bacterium]HRY70946.1 hypothetical protein [Phycisphaerae bacterium]HSA29193.1 hypothetical protein [Phycisphaerae bacterium]
MMNRTLWTGVVLISGCLRAAPGEQTASATGPWTGQARIAWFERCLVGMEVGPTGAQSGSDPSDVGYASRFDGREVVRNAAAAHAEYLVIWARDGEYAYYDSRVQPKCPGLGSRDVLRETIEEARQRRLPVIAYCVLQYPTQTLREHPDWTMLDAEGKRMHPRVCFNSPYAAYVEKMLAEMLGYGIDGFHLDMVDQGFGPPYGCWCDNCRRLFEKEYGRPMPKGVSWDEDWDRMLELRYDSSAGFEKRLREYVRSVNPSATVDFNYHGSPPFSWETGQRPVQHAHIGDFVTGETGVWGFSALGVGLSAEFLAATKPGAIFQVAMQRGVRMYHDQTTRPLNDIRWELLTLLAHGARVTMVDKTGYDGWLDPVAYERIGAAFEEALAKRGHFGQKPVQEVGIYYSSRTRDWYGREKPADYQQSFNGMHKALTYEHIPCGVILDENATVERLRRFPVVCLANTGIVSLVEADLFRRYLEDGGNLLITGLTGSLDRFGRPLKESSFADLIGATPVGKLDSLDNHVRLPAGGDEDAGRLRGGIPAGWPLLVKGPALIYKPTTAAAVGELMRPHRTVRQKQGKEGTEWPMSADAPVGPAVLVNRFGKGRVVTFACSPDFATASEHHIVEARKLLGHAVRLLNPAPVVEVTAPTHVEAVVTEDAAGRTLRVHLLGYLSPPACTPAKDRPYVLASMIEDAPLYRASIRVRRPLRQVRAWNPTTNIKRQDEVVVATVNDIHEILVIEY